MIAENDTEDGGLMKRWLNFLVVSFVLISPQLLAAQQQGDVAAGKTVYTKSCAACHGVAGEGKDALAKALKVEMRRFGSKEVQAKSDEELRKDVADGVGKMKPVKGVSDPDLRNIIAYMRTLQKG
jgi:mono/diheme cytochrome c family protein